MNRFLRGIGRRGKAGTDFYARSVSGDDEIGAAEGIVEVPRDDAVRVRNGCEEI